MFLNISSRLKPNVSKLPGRNYHAKKMFSRTCWLGMACLICILMTVPSIIAQGQVGKSAVSAAKIDINSATQKELEGLPSVGEATAKKIQSTTAIANTPPPAAGMVWVNLETKVYHKEGDRWYGKTKNGKYMNEADAIKAGYRAVKEREKK
jgi:hypothetical protein